MLFFNYENLIDPFLRDVRLAMPGFSGMKAGETVLDVCCGTGAQTIEYAKHGLLATGFDIEEKMLAVGRKNSKRLGLKNASFWQGDATSMPFKDKAFGYVSISFALHDKENSTQNKIIDEIKRVVKPQGSLLFIDFSIPLPKNIWAVGAKTIEFVAGGSHYQGFKSYSREGGLNAILKRHLLEHEKTAYFKNGIVAVVKASMPRDPKPG